MFMSAATHRAAPARKTPRVARIVLVLMSPPIFETRNSNRDLGAGSYYGARSPHPDPLPRGEGEEGLDGVSRIDLGRATPEIRISPARRKSRRCRSNPSK